MSVSIQVDLTSMRQQGPTTGYGTFEHRGMWTGIEKILELNAKWREKALIQFKIISWDGKGI